MNKKQQQEEAKKPVSIHHGADGKPDGILVQTLDEAFILALHDEKDLMTYDKAEKYDLPTAKQAHLYGAYLDEINKALDEAGGDRLMGWYWTKTPSAGSVNTQLVFYGTYGYLIYGTRIGSSRVRVSLALEYEKTLKP